MTYTSQSSPAINLLYPGISGAIISNDATTPNTKLVVSAGIMRDQSDTYDINLGNAGGVYSNIAADAITTIDSSVVGLNGIDTGVLQASKIYYVYAISDATNFNLPGAMISLSSPAENPILPAGYNIYRHIGFIHTDNSVHFLSGYWYGTGNARNFAYETPRQVGSSLNSTTKATIALAGTVPDQVNLQAIINASITPATAGNVLTIYPYDAIGSQRIVTGQVSTVSISDQFIVTVLLNSGSAALSYTVSNASDSANVFVYGYFYTV